MTTHLFKQVPIHPTKHIPAFQRKSELPLLAEVATNKEGYVGFRTQASLKKSFEEALAEHGDFGSSTSFFEGAMNALILAVRQKRKIAIPPEFIDVDHVRKSRRSSQPKLRQK